MQHWRTCASHHISACSYLTQWYLSNAGTHLELWHHPADSCLQSERYTGGRITLADSACFTANLQLQQQYKVQVILLLLRCPMKLVVVTIEAEPEAVPTEANVTVSQVANHRQVRSKVEGMETH